MQQTNEPQKTINWCQNTDSVLRKVLSYYSIFYTFFFCQLNPKLKFQLKSLNFIYFTTITKQVIQLILIMLVGTVVCVRMLFVWEETGVPGGNPPV